MLFNSAQYGIFLLATLTVFWLLKDTRFLRALFLVVASYGFYFYGTFDTAREQDVPLGPLGWSALCLGIVFFGSTIDYAIGRALDNTSRPAIRKALLLVSIIYYLGVLSLFKYFNFAVDSIAQVASMIGISIKPIHLRLVLPFGISFFTFETMSYTIDVYRREIPACKRYLDYLLFVSFFPHLVAGPIVRPRTMLPQFAARPVADAAMQLSGLWLIAVGLAKKIVIGDYLSVNLVGRVFDNPERYTSIEAVVAVYAYAIQIYCDFSGYTDVAIGSANLFGYQLPPNFDAPYTSHNLQEFWRRWHISLSSWLRDYLYIPLGGSRGGPWKTYRNLMITMLLGGLWHGASWNFVIWGAIHGAALAVTRMWQRARGDSPPTGISRGVCVAMTFHVVCFAWIFFRAPTFAHAELILVRIARLPLLVAGPIENLGAPNLSMKTLAVLMLGGVTHFTPRRWLDAARDSFVRSPAVVQGAVLACVVYALHRMAGVRAEPFVYGQF